MNLGLSLLEMFGLFKPVDYDHNRFESLRGKCNEIEQVFWDCGYFYLSKYGEITPQVEIGPYRVDFAITGTSNPRFDKVVIEIDGHEWHKSKKQRQHDYERERWLQSEGWRVIRFTGTDVFTDPQKCVKEVAALILKN